MGPTFDHPTLTTIKQRRSIREFQPDATITRSEWQALVEAGLCAPFAAADSRHFTVLQNAALLKQIDDAAKDCARLMKIPGLEGLAANPDYSCIYDAPTLIVVSGRENSPGPESDCAAATQNILLAAEALGLGACWIYFCLLAFFGPEGEALQTALQIPQGFKPYTSVALGYKTDTPPPLPPLPSTEAYTFIS